MATNLPPLASRDLTRRQWLATVGAAAGGATLLGLGCDAARDSHASIVVADPGGLFEPAFGKAFYRPFEAESGIRVRNIAREHFPYSQIRAQVETRSYSWDVVTVTLAGVDLLGDEYLEPILWSDEHAPHFIDAARSPVWLGTDVYATILAYRRDRYGENGPRSWADFFDVRRFPGRRSLHRTPIDTLEIALLADGVPPEQLYPLDIERALARLTEIRRHIHVWWAGGAQSSQLLESGEVDMIAIWNARAQLVHDAGAPIGVAWDQGLYSIEGWAIPKGNPRADLGRQFISFCQDPRRQADFTDILAYGPTNLRAYDHIAQDRARVLPTAPQHFDRLILSDQKWWGVHKDAVDERFNQWLLS